MSTYVYVTRRDDPLDDDGPQITLAEWQQVVAADPDLALAEPEDRAPKDPTVYAVWKAFPGGYPAWFGWIAGNIEVKGFDDDLLVKLRTFAAALDARIVSEEGELFE